MKVKMLKPATVRNASSGNLDSYACGQIVELDSTPGNALISAGIAEAYTAVTPSGKLSVTGTSEVDCASYATAQVSDANLVAGNIKKDVTILGVTGTLE